MCNAPPESAVGVWLDPYHNIWIDDAGYEHLDLTDFGFSARQRQTIWLLIAKNPEEEYLLMYNSDGEPIEIFWSYEPETEYTYGYFVEGAYDQYKRALNRDNS